MGEDMSVETGDTGNEQGDVFDCIATHWRKSGISWTFLMRKLLTTDPKMVKEILEGSIYERSATKLVFEHDVVPEGAVPLYMIDAVRHTWIYDPLSNRWLKHEHDENSSNDRIHIPLSPSFGGDSPEATLSRNTRARFLVEIAFKKLVPTIVDQGCFFMVRRAEAGGSFSLGLAFVLDSTFQGMSAEPPEWWDSVDLPYRLTDP